MKKLSIAIAAFCMIVASQAFAGCPGGMCSAPQANVESNCNQEYASADCPTISYVPYVTYTPSYYCVPRTECYNVTKYKKCTTCRDECYQVRRCRMVPQYYYETCTRKVPECHWEPYTVECKKTCYDKYCKQIPRCCYRKVVSYNNGSACNPCDNGNMNGNNAPALQPAPADITEPRKVAEGLSSPSAY